MRVIDWYVEISFVLIVATAPHHAQGANIDVSGVRFNSFGPNPIASGQHATSFGATYDWVTDRTFNAPVGFTFAITLSANTTIGDADDIPIGSVNLSVPLSSTFFAGTNTHTFNSTPHFGGLKIPPSTQAGEYHAFLAIAPRSPHVDPIPDETPGKLPNTVTVGMPSLPVGDYNDDGTVDAADYVAWRDGGALQNDATPGNQPEDYGVWRANFGVNLGDNNSQGNIEELAQVPEPSAAFLVAIVLMVLTSGRSSLVRPRVRVDARQGM